MRSGAVRGFVEKIVRANKSKLEFECEERIKMVRDASVLAKDSREMHSIMAHKGITKKNYYTYNQLRYVPEFNFKENQEAEHILGFMERELRPKLVDIVEESDEPQELSELKSDLIRY